MRGRMNRRDNGWCGQKRAMLRLALLVATPFVAAAAAVIEAARPTCTPAAIEAVLASTATDRGTAGRDDLYGAGVVDAQQALNAATC